MLLNRPTNCEVIKSNEFLSLANDSGMLLPLAKDACVAVIIRIFGTSGNVVKTRIGLVTVIMQFHELIVDY